MKIVYKTGDALDGPERYLAHGCNAKGVMNSGIARQIRERYPKNYEYYKKTYDKFGLRLGYVYPYTLLSWDKVILNCITQENYGRSGDMYVSYEAIKNCMTLISVQVPLEEPVAMPKIGAGLGGGYWNDIEKIVEEFSTFQPVVYEYD